MKIHKIVFPLFLLLFVNSCKGKETSIQKSISKDDVVLCSIKNQSVKIFTEVATDPEKMFTPAFSKPAGTAKPNSKAILVESFEQGFEAEPIAEKIELQDGTNGWVAENNVCIPAKVIKEEENKKSYLRNGETFSHKKVEELSKGDIIFVQKNTYSTVENFKGCENDWYFSVSPKGNVGYIHCSYVKAVK